jgi:hypothetical protein
VVSVTPRPRFTPEKGPPVPIVQEAGWAPEPVWTQRLEEISSLPPPGIEPRSLGRPAHSQTLYCLSYPAHRNNVTVSCLYWCQGSTRVSIILTTTFMAKRTERRNLVIENTVTNARVALSRPLSVASITDSPAIVNIQHRNYWNARKPFVEQSCSSFYMYLLGSLRYVYVSRPARVNKHIDNHIPHHGH